MIKNPITSPSTHLEKFTYGFFTRNDGFSDGIYNSLNCSTISNDQLSNVLKNRERIIHSIGKEADDIVFPSQKHSNKCQIIGNKIPEIILADALVTNRKNLILSILTADCAPILLYENKEQIIGAIHAGWKGAKNGIIQNTIKKIIELGGNTKNIVSIIGPCIQQKSYEVGKEFYEDFILQEYKNREMFIKKEEKYLFDLPKYCISILTESGIKIIDNIGMCTFKNGNDFFSYRRSVIKGEVDYGRQANAIMLKN
jgi:polyphenol oxidase